MKRLNRSLSLRGYSSRSCRDRTAVRRASTTRAPRRSCEYRGSYLFGDPTREEPLWAEHEHKDDDSECEGVLERGRYVGGKQILKHADHQAADNCAGEAVETTQDRTGKCLQQNRKHHFEIKERQRCDNKTYNH